MLELTDKTWADLEHQQTTYGTVFIPDNTRLAPWTMDSFAMASQLNIYFYLDYFFALHLGTYDLPGSLANSLCADMDQQRSPGALFTTSGLNSAMENELTSSVSHWACRQILRQHKRQGSNSRGTVRLS
jgi:hypothetical protein